MRQQLIALNTLVRKELIRIIRIWTQTLLPPLVTQSLYFLIFGAFIGSQIGDVHGINYMAFIVPGLVMMAVISGSFGNVVSSFFGSKFQRSIEEMLVSPMKSWVILAGYVIAGTLRGVVVGVMVFGVSCFFVKPIIMHPWIVLGFMFISAVMFSLAAMINGIFARNFDEVAFFQNFVLTPLIYLGGVFYSIARLPEVWQHISYANPLVYMVNGLRFGFYGFSDVNVLMSAVLLVVLTIILWFVNIWLLDRGIGIKN